MTQYVALLRGINVGGKNLIRMTDLKAAFEEMGLAHVTTYIQSGNVLFASTEKSVERLTAVIEAALSERFGYKARTILLSAREMKRVVEDAPAGFGGDPEQHRYDVIFLKPSLTGVAAAPQIPQRDGVDHVSPGENVVYASRLKSAESSSMLSKIAVLPLYQLVTIRNWNTTTKLLALMEGQSTARPSGKLKGGMVRSSTSVKP